MKIFLNQKNTLTVVRGSVVHELIIPESCAQAIMSIIKSGSAEFASRDALMSSNAIQSLITCCTNGNIKTSNRTELESSNSKTMRMRG